MKQIPVVDLNKCSGKGDCAHVCTQHVFQIKPISANQYRQLSLKGKLKTIFSNGKKSNVINPESCIKCGKCSASCQAKAINLFEN